MKSEIFYEWYFETIDEHGDIIDHNFSDTLDAYSKSDEGNLVLVQNIGNNIEGLKERRWAYVKNERLPEYFTDSYENVVGLIPKRFHTELEKYFASKK